ncbi:UvrD-helicase domain-containing protein [Reyranella soli]|uniref:DNA 3'-5' helicase II n=1 Tax=Reyranella soli TaxID=1230389 RepID=A0A512NQ10_9HYPH|nr:UvrD-helicase domain-containing protein [Reyranella soli]GEP61036.1 DNA helicase [Reyranella soli]
MDLTKPQQAILDASGHLLITGGPGAGKTTIAILKAGQLAQEAIRAGQRIMFLSFARATVSRVIEAMDQEKALSTETKKRIVVDTYHAFFWQLLKTHGYLLGLPRRLLLLTPPNESIALSGIRAQFKADRKLTDQERNEKRQHEDDERLRLAMTEGRVCFNLFADLGSKLLKESDKLRKIVSTQYPFIILDEFQDTNPGQWDVVRMMGLNSTLIALADPEQRIFDFIGADPKRLDQFRETFKPTEIPLGSENHRSKGTEITDFGNDVLTGKFRQSKYQGIELFYLQAADNMAFAALAGHTLKAKERLIKSKKRGWSVAVLVPTKALTRHVSEIFLNPLGSMPAIPHAAAIDVEAAILAAEVVSFLMQPHSEDHFEAFVDLLCSYFRGKGGDDPGVTALREADSIKKSCAKFLKAVSAGTAPPSKSVMVKMREVYDRAKAVKLTGNPDEDWKAVRGIVEAGACPRLREVGEAARNVRLLDRGTQLRQALALDWRLYGAYRNALAITQTAFVQEHFASAHKPETGVVVMNMHKAKGKQFDEVILFERGPRMQGRKIVAQVDRFVRNNERIADLGQERQSFRVSVTRARLRTTILTPGNDPSVLLA